MSSVACQAGSHRMHLLRRSVRFQSQIFISSFRISSISCLRQRFPCGRHGHMDDRCWTRLADGERCDLHKDWVFPASEKSQTFEVVRIGRFKAQEACPQSQERSVARSPFRKRHNLTSSRAYLRLLGLPKPDCIGKSKSVPF